MRLKILPTLFEVYLIPLKLVKIAADQLVKTLACIINSALNDNIFPNKAKEACVTPVDKGGHDKHAFPNYKSNYQFFIKFPYPLMNFSLFYIGDRIVTNIEPNMHSEISRRHTFYKAYAPIRQIVIQ